MSSGPKKYCARITRANPAAFVVLIDQSGSMEEPARLFGQRMSKAEAVALVANMLLSEIIYRSTKQAGVRDYFHLSIMGYSGGEVYPLTEGGGSDVEGFVATSGLARRDVRTRSYTRERILPSGESFVTTARQKFWVEPLAHSSTPMYQALMSASELVARWCSRTAHSASYPPVVFNITNGEASDADDDRLLEIAARIRSIATSDGNALLINCHINTDQESEPLLFPCSPECVAGSRHAQLLFGMSSEMPERYNDDILHIKQGDVRPPFRGMSYNSSIDSLLTMIDIGSTSINMIEV